MKDIIVAFTLAAGLLWVASDKFESSDPKSTEKYEQTQPTTPRLSR